MYHVLVLCTVVICSNSHGFTSNDNHHRTALLALAALPPVLADARAAALLAIVALPPVLAEAGAAALLASVAPPPVLAEAGAVALFA